LKLSVVIPACNEEGSVAASVKGLFDFLSREGIDHEILVVNDNSTDGTEKILKDLLPEIPSLKYVNNIPPGGFGRAVRLGFGHASGGCVALMMADASDSPEDLVAFYRKMLEGNYDAVFGSRFVPGGRAVGYPIVKYILNRMANQLIRLLFGLKYNDVTNAFKLYRRETIEGLKPFLSPHFNLTVELPLKVIVRGYSYTYLPNSWVHRKSGASKLRIKEMGSRYFFIIFYCLIEKYLTLGDYKKNSNR